MGQEFGCCPSLTHSAALRLLFDFNRTNQVHLVVSTRADYPGHRLCDPRHDLSGIAAAGSESAERGYRTGYRGSPQFPLQGDAAPGERRPGRVFAGRWRGIQTSDSAGQDYDPRHPGNH